MQNKHVLEIFSRRSGNFFEVQVWNILIELEYQFFYLKPEILIDFNWTYITGFMTIVTKWQVTSYRRLQTSHRRVTDNYRRVTDKYRQVQTSHRRVQTSHRRITCESQTTTNKSQTSHKQLPLHTNHSESFFEYIYIMHFFQKGYGFPNAPRKRLFLLKERKSRIWCLLKWWNLSLRINQTILSF